MLDSRVYQLIHSGEKGCVKDRCFDRIAQTIVKKPRENGKISRSFFRSSRFALMNSGNGMRMISRSLERLKLRFTVRWCICVAHCISGVGVSQKPAKDVGYIDWKDDCHCRLTDKRPTPITIVERHHGDERQSTVRSCKLYSKRLPKICCKAPVEQEKACFCSPTNIG